MYAIVRTGGAQFRVEPGMKVVVPHIAGDEGTVFEMEDVLLLAKDDKVLVGQPVIEGVKVRAKILSQSKAPKVVVFKRKKRKGYQRKTGHRQLQTWVEIESIVRS